MSTYADALDTLTADWWALVMRAAPEDFAAQPARERERWRAIVGDSLKNAGFVHLDERLVEALKAGLARSEEK